ncbi:MAG: DJ-1/PfpI family protein [Firmicutes bacterium]|nr:DJ-1/PfpI family protein [Bacillota bacterium]
MKFYCLLYKDFETLDMFGPVEILGRTKDSEMHFLSAEGGIVTSVHGVPVMTEKTEAFAAGSVLVIPGGIGTRPLVQSKAYLDMLKALSDQAEYVLTVCTGSALLAKSGALDGRSATSNKLSFEWVKTNSDAVSWQGSARWVHDGKFYTASGISAGLDMALGFVADVFGKEEAQASADWLEYIWNDDCSRDPFAVE